MDGRWFTQNERWDLSRCEHFEVDPDPVAGQPGEGIREVQLVGGQAQEPDGCAPAHATSPASCDGCRTLTHST